MRLLGAKLNIDNLDALDMSLNTESEIHSSFYLGIIEPLSLLMIGNFEGKSSVK